MSSVANPQVSILIPTYNRSWGLAIALKSAMQQDHPSCEIIVTDDCSSDDTGEVVRSLADDRVRYFRQPIRRGMVGNWGAALDMAQGEYVVFLADDDYLGLRFVSRRVEALAGSPRAVVAFSQYEIRDLNGVLLDTMNKEHQHFCNLEAGSLLHAALSRMWFVGASMYRKAAVLQAWPAIMEDDLVLDFGLNIELSVGGCGGIYLPECDFTMRAHSGQNSQAKLMPVYEQGRGVLARYLQREMPEAMRRMIRRELSSWHVNWGRMMARTGEHIVARQQFRRAIAVDPGHGWAWRQLIKASGWR